MRTAAGVQQAWGATYKAASHANVTGDRSAGCDTRDSGLLVQYEYQNVTSARYWKLELSDVQFCWIFPGPRQENERGKRYMHERLEYSESRIQSHSNQRAAV